MPLGERGTLLGEERRMPLREEGGMLLGEGGMLLGEGGMALGEEGTPSWRLRLGREGWTPVVKVVLEGKQRRTLESLLALLVADWGSGWWGEGS
jgi:hypothetical protein